MQLAMMLDEIAHKTVLTDNWKYEYLFKKI